MNATTKKEVISLKDCFSLDTQQLAKCLGCGKQTAIEIGEAAGARITISNNRRVLWNVKKIQEYLDSISA
ncbi:hypothetical protein [Butyrivibrio sp. AC2005]|uniref:hypothetical protein n=1 Tax=Butyrivibrio sp. AC2005 TaxID=1280672 RepID=UPI000415B3AB|nr:hypothetical protein [Butyrivibrio sp. AC2005]